MNLFEELQNNQHLLEMANLVGNSVKVDDINFSFYFSDKFIASHAIRVKIIWNRNKMQSDLNGYLELHGNYKYISNNSKKISSKDVEHARLFFKKYKVLFAAVWECELDSNHVIDYLRGKINFKELLNGFDELENTITLEDWELIKETNNLMELENVVRNYNLFNMND